MRCKSCYISNICKIHEELKIIEEKYSCITSFGCKYYKEKENSKSSISLFNLEEDDKPNLFDSIKKDLKKSTSIGIKPPSKIHINNIDTHKHEIKSIVNCKNCDAITISEDIKKCSKCGIETCSDCGVDVIDIETDTTRRYCNNCNAEE